MHLLPGRPLVLAAELVAAAMSRLAAGHRMAVRSGLDIDDATWTLRGHMRGWPAPPESEMHPRISLRLRRSWLNISYCARRAGPREHGRQAARSVRDRPGGQASHMTDSAMSAPP
jgi:hypothetical protein